MYSTIQAVLDLLGHFLEKKKSPPKKPEKKPEVSPLKNYVFSCYLCSAENKFSMEAVTKKTYRKADCIRCGYENKVVLTPPKVAGN